MQGVRGDHRANYRVFIKYCFFSKNSRKVATSPWAAMGCTKNYQPIGVTVHSHCVEGILQRCRQGRGEIVKKNIIFPEHPVPYHRTDIHTYQRKGKRDL